MNGQARAFGPIFPASVCVSVILMGYRTSFFPLLDTIARQIKGGQSDVFWRENRNFVIVKNKYYDIQGFIAISFFREKIHGRGCQSV